MIYLHTLGDTLIKVGEKEVRPSAPLVFAALLYLSVERGRRVPRAALQELFFPESDERSGSHNVRQLLYKLRQLGAPLIADDHAVSLAQHVVTDLFEASLDVASLSAIESGYLPAYSPHVSDAFARWIETSREQHTARIVRALLSRLRQQFDSGSLDEARRVSTVVLHHDPFNEEATLTRAKVMALSGQQHQAVALLADYSKEVGNELRLPAETLRRRIHIQGVMADAESVLVGRDFELRSLLAQQANARRGQLTTSLLWGEPGIGKTRLAQEVAERVRLEGDRVLWAHCQQHAVERPMGVLTDLVPGLMKCRGSLGVSPESMSWLRRLEVRSAHGSPFDTDLTASETSHNLKLAIKDLITSIASESAILIIVEDVQWIDDASRDFLQRHMPAMACLHVLMTSRDCRLASEHASQWKAHVRKLEALSPEVSARLLDVLLPPDKDVAYPLRRTCAALANGNPLFLRTIAHHLALSGGLPDAETGIADLMLQRLNALQPASLLLMRVISVLGTVCTNERIKRCAPLDPFTLLLALQELSDKGLIVRRESSLVCVHQILADTVLRNIPEPLRAELFLVAASQLENEGQTTREASLLWACAEYWCSGGQPNRAITALRQCAAYAAELGQPRYAIPAMERAQDFCSHTELPGLLEATVRFADMATDDAAVLRNADQYRRVCQQILRGEINNRLVELAEIRALRRLGKDIWPARAMLLRDALSEAIPMRDRRRAARTYLVSAEESFGGEEASNQLTSLESLWRDSNDVDAVELEMLAYLTTGKVTAAVPTAMKLLARIDEFPAISQPITLSAVARALFAGGLVDESLEVSKREFALAIQMGIDSDIAMAAARLADSFLTLGDLATARQWVDTADAHIAANPFPRAYHLYNCVMLAIADGNFAQATTFLEELKSLDEAKKKHAVRSIAGMAMILANARGTIESEPFDIDELRLLDDAAWLHGEHLLFAVGLFLLLMANGLKHEGQTRLREYFTRRRQECYDPWIAIAPYHITATQLRQLQNAVMEFGPSPLTVQDFSTDSRSAANAS